MSHDKTAILVVDDTKFSNAVIRKTLEKGGFKDVRYCYSASDALKLLAEREANVLIADWLMPEMDGLQLAEKVREIDNHSQKFTYIMLLTAKEGNEALAEAFDRGVDDFISKSVMSDQLLPRILAAARTSMNQNNLLAKNRVLQSLSTLDKVTGVGNLNYAMSKLSDTIEQYSTSNGAACYVHMTIHNADDLEQNYNPDTIDAALKAVAERIRQLSQPLDSVTRVGEYEFAVIKHIPDLLECNPVSFRKLHENLNVKPIKTPLGYLDIKTAVSVCASDTTCGPSTAEGMRQLAKSKIDEGTSSNVVIVTRWNS